MIDTDRLLAVVPLMDIEEVAYWISVGYLNNIYPSALVKALTDRAHAVGLIWVNPLPESEREHIDEDYEYDDGDWDEDYTN